MVDTTVRVEIKDDGRYVYHCGTTTNGIDWARVGCEHGAPREAIDHTKLLVSRRSELREFLTEMSS